MALNLARFVPPRFKGWLQRQFGFLGGVNLRLIWPDNWYQAGRDPPTDYALLTHPAVFAAIDIISSDIARLQMRHWRDNGESRQEVLDSWACGVLDKPNEYETGFDLMKRLISSQLYRGNGYIYGLRNRRNQFDTLHCLFPDFVWPYRVPGSADYFYQISAQPMAELDTQRMIPPRAILHHRMQTMGDPLTGITPLVGAARSASAGLAILRQSERFFTRMARPSGVLQSDGKIDQQTAQRIKERFQKFFAGEEGAGDIAVLEEGLKWSPLTMTAVEAQLIEQLRYSVEDIARVYRIPVFMLGDASKASTGSSEQMSRNYFSLCLAPHMKAIEWRISQYFGMDARREFLEFDQDALFKGEFKERIEALARSVQGGIRTPNEARKVEGLDKVEGGDTVFMQQQMTPVQQLATRSDLNPMPGLKPPPQAQTPTRDLMDLDLDPFPFPDPDQELTAALMEQVFRDEPAPLPRPQIPYRHSALARRHAERKLIYGRVSTAYH
jgi:HK97 family phage portal protein